VSRSLTGSSGGAVLKGAFSRAMMPAGQSGMTPKSLSLFRGTDLLSGGSESQSGTINRSCPDQILELQLFQNAILFPALDHRSCFLLKLFTN
jgi:hypothetical protein